VDISARDRRAADFLAWLTAEDRDGVVSIGQLDPEPYRKSFSLRGPGSLDNAAFVACALGLWVRVPVYFDGSSVEPENIARAHTSACRFLYFDAVDVAELEPAPNVTVALGDTTYCLWGMPEPITGHELAALQSELRDRLGNDPSWSASTAELIPIPGVVYAVDGEDVEAVELEPVAS